MVDPVLNADPAPLSNTTLHSLRAEVDRPTYDRSTLTPGIVHIGVGNFHRAHLSWYVHRLMQSGQALDWAIVGAGVRPNDATMRDKLLAQDGLTTLIELSPDGQKAEIVGPMIDFLPVEADNTALIAQIASPATRIVSMTVTEGGYFVDSTTGAFDPQHPDIQFDAAHPRAPRTVFGAIVAGLSQRKANGSGPCTILSCDNLQGNGDVARDAVVSLAKIVSAELGAWIDESCSFPNSMVDCIVPATGPEELAIARSFGIDDHAPVTHEFFRQWVIEDAFCAGRPNWENVGAILTDRVHDYESMKIRILNAGHQILANAGELLSQSTIADCMTHPDIQAFFRKVQRAEIVPYVSDVPGMTPSAYVELIERRFANPAIKDTTRRVAFDGSSRHTGFLLPILRDARAAGGPIDGLALAEALWARMCAGTREDGSKIEPNDPHWDDLMAAARSAQERPQSWLEQSRLYGDLADDARFSEAFERWLSLIWAEGSAVALQTYCNAR